MSNLFVFYRIRIFVLLATASALILAGCSLASEPTPVGPIETGPLPGEVASTPAPTEEAVEEEPAEEVVEEEPVPEAEPTEVTGEEVVAEEDTPAEDEEAPLLGVVQGQVSNATESAAVPTDLEVHLSGIAVDMMNNFEEFLTLTKTINEDGTFVFEDLPFDKHGAAYVVSTVYNGVEFSNGTMITPDTDDTVLEITLTIYESTSDPAAVTVEAMHFIIREHPDTLLVTQLYVFNNDSDRIFISPDPVSGGRYGSVAIGLPPDAYDVMFEEGQLGGRFIALGDLIYDTWQLLPGRGEHGIFVSYFVPYDGPREIEIPILYQTNLVNVLTQEGIRIRSEQLGEAGVETIEDRVYDKHIGQNLAAGDALIFTVQTPSTTNWLPIIVGVGLALLVIGGVVHWFIWGRKATIAPVADGLTGEETGLIRQIAELDEAFEAGRVNQFEYEARRADLKAALAKEFQPDD